MKKQLGNLVFLLISAGILWMSVDFYFQDVGVDHSEVFKGEIGRLTINRTSKTTRGRSHTRYYVKAYLLDVNKKHLGEVSVAKFLREEDAKKWILTAKGRVIEVHKRVSGRGDSLALVGRNDVKKNLPIYILFFSVGFIFFTFSIYNFAPDYFGKFISKIPKSLRKKISIFLLGVLALFALFAFADDFYTFKFNIYDKAEIFIDHKTS